MRRETTSSFYNGLIHAGAGTGLAVVQLSALIPGLLPTIALLARRISAGRVQTRRHSRAPHVTP
jgi:hypothetical protein